MRVRARCDIKYLDETTFKQTSESPNIKTGDEGFVDVSIIKGVLFIGFVSIKTNKWYLLPYELKEWFDEIVEG